MDSHFHSHLSRRRHLERLVFASQSSEADQEADRSADREAPWDDEGQRQGLRWIWRWRSARVFIVICLFLALIAGAVHTWNSRVEEDNLLASDAESPSAHTDSAGSISSSSSGTEGSGGVGSGLSGQVMVHMTGEVRLLELSVSDMALGFRRLSIKLEVLRKTRTVTALTWPGWSLMVNRSRFLL